MPEQCSCERLEKKIDQLIAQTQALPMKGKRAPSEWQKYLKICVPKKTGAFPERIKACSVEYKRR